MAKDGPHEECHINANSFVRIILDLTVLALPTIYKQLERHKGAFSGFGASLTYTQSCRMDFPGLLGVPPGILFILSALRILQYFTFSPSWIYLRLSIEMSLYLLHLHSFIYYKNALCRYVVSERSLFVAMHNEPAFLYNSAGVTGILCNTAEHQNGHPLRSRNFLVVLFPLLVGGYCRLK